MAFQAIAKLANIHLTPEKPRYEGGSWHVEGQLVSYRLPCPELRLMPTLVALNEHIHVPLPYIFMTALAVVFASSNNLG